MQLGVYSLITHDCTVEKTAKLVAEIGYAGIEWTVDYPDALWDGKSNWHIDTTDLENSARAARQAARENGLAVTVVCPRCRCTELDGLRLGMQAAQLTGAFAVRVLPSLYDGTRPYGQLFDQARAALKALERMARDMGVKALLEIHNGTIAASTAATRRLLDGFDPECLGAIFDPGNMVREGMENWRMAIEMLGPYVQHVHVKDIGWLRDKAGRWHYVDMALDEGMVDWKQVIEGLRSIGYEGFLSIEDFRGGRLVKSAGLSTRQKLQEDYDYLKALLK